MTSEQQTSAAPDGARPSEWQQQIEGEWHGCPSVFNAAGDHVGYNKVHRSSVFQDGRTLYTMDTRLDAVGPLRARFEARDFAFGVNDTGRDRIYLGPDFVGAGHPYGALVDAHYYSPAWRADLRTMVHVLPDAGLQVYSSLLYDGPTICAVFNGVYRVAFDYADNPETQREIDAFTAREREHGARPHVLPFKDAGAWRGEMQVYGPEQEALGTAALTIRYRPITLLRAEVEVELTGAIERRFKYVRERQGHRHSFEGPDLYGNAIGYGRALYTSQHVFGEALKIRGREFIIDDDWTMSVVWQLQTSDRRAQTLFGLVRWTPEERVLTARFK